MSGNSLTDLNPSGIDTPNPMGKFTHGGANAVGTPLVNTFYPIDGNGTNSTIFNNVASQAPVAGAMSKLIASVDVAPGSGESITFTFYKNGTSTGLQVILTGPTTTFGIDLVNSINYTATDKLGIQIVCSAGCLSSRVNYGMLDIIP